MLPRRPRWRQGGDIAQHSLASNRQPSLTGDDNISGIEAGIAAGGIRRYHKKSFYRLTSKSEPKLISPPSRAMSQCNARRPQCIVQIDCRYRFSQYKSFAAGLLRPDKASRIACPPASYCRRGDGDYTAAKAASGISPKRARQPAGDRSLARLVPPCRRRLCRRSMACLMAANIRHRAIMPYW